MDIITQSENDNPNQCYVPFVYFDNFPGIDIRYPVGVKISKFHNKNLKFLSSIQNQQYDSKHFNKLISDLFDQTRKTKAFKDMSLKVSKPSIDLEEGEIPEIEISLFPITKPFLPNKDEIISWRGAYLHFQFNNLLKHGEKLSSGVTFNQRYYGYLTKFRFPLETSSLKIRIQQSKNFHNQLQPTKFIDFRLHETTLETEKQRNYIDYSFRLQQRSTNTQIENGLRVQWLYDVYMQDYKSKILKNRERLSLSLNLWPTSNQSNINIKYNMQMELNLYKIWPESIRQYMFMGWKNIFQIEGSLGGTVSPGYLQGFSHMNDQNRYYVTNYSRFYFSQIQILRQQHLYPYVSASFAYQPGINKTNASLGIGIQISFLRKYRLFLQSNLIHLYGNKDKVLSYELYLD